jgi:hypothetical protein
MTMATAADKPREGIAWIALAAAPVFALMAALSFVDGPPPALCSAGSGLIPFDGMTAMYLLMTLFHLPPWLTLAADPPKGE